MSRAACVVLGILVASICLVGVESVPYGGYGLGGYGYGIEGCGEPLIPLGSGLVDAYSFTDSYHPGSSYCGYGTYGPAYGGLGYPLEVYGLAPYHHHILGGYHGGLHGGYLGY